MELAPGIFTASFVPRGTFFVMREPVGGNGPAKGVAINDEDWAAIPGALRERFLDEMVRIDSDRGLREIERRWLRV